MIGVLKNTPLSQEQKEYVETVESSGEALLDLVNDILDFSKIGTRALFCSLSVTSSASSSSGPRPGNLGWLVTAMPFCRARQGPHRSLNFTLSFGKNCCGLRLFI
jgi:signal transduction histidine kinase